MPYLPGMNPNSKASPDGAADAPGAAGPSWRVQGVRNDEVIAEARKRYQRASSAASKNRERFKAAMRFVAGEQWDPLLKQMREAQLRPCLVMDRLGTHINQVVNDQRQNKPAIKVHPDGDLADVDAAKVFDGVIRNIEYLSNAPMVYETAAYTQVAGGQGAWRVLTRYVDDNAFEQEIVLQRILDPTSVTFDDMAKEQDGSDAMFAFIDTTMRREDFEREYPDVHCGEWPSITDDQGWWSADSVRLAEYYRVVMRPTTLHLMPNGEVMDDATLAQANAGAPLQPLVPVQSRPAKMREVQWFKLGGNSVLDSRVWPGKWIPLVRIVGNEMLIDGEVIYTGLTHRAMDAQRMYNYQTSVVVEQLSLQKSAPYIGAKGQFKGVEAKWRQANTTNPAYLEYEPVDINGTLAPVPQRQPAPGVPVGNVQAMEIAAQDLQWVTGQHAANFGAQSNETSGRAIMARQREGDAATYHYVDNLSRGILHTGRILVDLVPKVMDTRRVLRVIGEDQTAEMVQQDPAQEAAVVKQQDATGRVQKIYNLGVGRYDVAVTVGPSFGTKRMESVEAMSQLLSGQAGQMLWPAIGDLFLRNQDWPGAQEMADRLKKMVPPNLLDAEKEGQNAEARVAEMEQALQQASMMMDERDQALQQASQAVQQLQEQLQTLQAEKLRADTDVESRTTEAAINAEKDVRVAEIQRDTEIARAQVARLEEDKNLLQQTIQFLEAELERARSEKEAPEAEGDGKPDTEEVLLQQVLANQTQMFGVVAELAGSLASQRRITIAKTPNGFEAVSVAGQAPGAQ